MPAPNSVLPYLDEAKKDPHFVPGHFNSFCLKHLLVKQRSILFVYEGLMLNKILYRVIRYEMGHKWTNINRDNKVESNQEHSTHKI